MRVAATPEAERVIRRVAEDRQDLVLVLGTGCCDSTAPFLYDRYEPGADAVEVGRAAGVPVFAHGWMAEMYAGADGLVLDVDQVVNDSFSLESEHGFRLTLRVPGPSS